MLTLKLQAATSLAFARCNHYDSHDATRDGTMLGTHAGYRKLPQDPYHGIQHGLAAPLEILTEFYVRTDLHYVGVRISYHEPWPTGRMQRPSAANAS